jgi:hypothetical protein
MKDNLIGGVMLIGVVGIAIYFAITSESTVEYQNDVATTTVVEMVEEEELDVVEESRKELERINNELDQEEQKLLEERQALDARLDEINSIRASFQ